MGFLLDGGIEWFSGYTVGTPVLTVLVLGGGEDEDCFSFVLDEWSDGLLEFVEGNDVGHLESDL